MKQGEKGFSLVELIIAVSIIALISGAAAIATFQVCKGTGHSNSYITAVHQAQNAGYWISRDAQMAQSMTTDNLTPPDFLVFSWTVWDENNDPIYHTATYFFKDMSDEVGKLKRRHWSSDGVNEETLVATHIYYATDDPANTSNISYQDSILTVQLTTLSEKIMETREYRIHHRPNF